MRTAAKPQDNPLDAGQLSIRPLIDGKRPIKMHSEK
jgi:hypothetical protein